VLLWLDDVRPMPVGFDLWAKTYGQAIEMIKAHDITFISFDHDLGTKETGYDVACFIENRAVRGIKPPDWAIQSSNPVGSNNIRMTMQSAHDYYSRVHDELEME